MDESKFQSSIADARRQVAEEILKEGLDDDDLVDKLKEMYDDKLGWCRCGNPRDALVAVYKYLSAIQYEHEYAQEYLEASFGVKNIWDNSLLLCLAYECDRACLTQHGSSIYGAWPDWNGIRFIMYLETLIIHGRTLDEIDL